MLFCLWNRRQTFRKQDQATLLPKTLSQHLISHYDSLSSLINNCYGKRRAKWSLIATCQSYCWIESNYEMNKTHPKRSMNSRSEERPWIPRALRYILHRSSCKVRYASNRKNGEMINVSICQKMTSSPWSAFLEGQTLPLGSFLPRDHHQIK